MRSLTVLLGLCLLSSCVKMPKEHKGGGVNLPAGDFDFATTKEIQLNIDYGLNDYSILFEVYDQNPLDELGVKIAESEPIFRAITDKEGRFQGALSSATAVKTLYFYTNYIGLPSVIEMPVSVKINIDLGANGRSRAVSSRGVVTGGGYKTIGDWDALGVPNDLLSRASLTGELMNNIMFSLPESVHGAGATGNKNGLIKEGEAIGDIRILKNTKINIVFMHEGASMTSTIAYYCFPTNNPPKSKEELTRVIALPNCSFAYSGGGLSSGDRVKLLYWNESQSKFVEEFPAGTTIGWVLLSSGFRNGDVNGTALNVYYTNPAFNPEETLKQHCVALRDDKKEIVALGFEDQNRERRAANGSLLGDSDFNDVIFYIETTNPDDIDKDGIPNIIETPEPNPTPTEYFIKYHGTLAFEDLWPAKGDYDMNDVVIDYLSTHYYNTSNKVVTIVDLLTPKWSGAGLQNGFGYQLGVTVADVKQVIVDTQFSNGLVLFKTDPKGLEMNQNKATVMLFENIHNLLSQNLKDEFKSFKVTIKLKEGGVDIKSLTTPPYNPFIVCGTQDEGVIKGGRGKEVHLPNMAPTNLADKTLLGKTNDKSDPSKGKYYISDDNYMFAINIPDTFMFPSEKQPINEAYPRFKTWASSGGVQDTDWYKDTKR